MNFRKSLPLATCALLLSYGAFAQSDDDNADPNTKGGKKHKHGTSVSVNTGDQTVHPAGRWYISNALDGAILSTASYEKPGVSRQLSTLRFSMINIGYNFNYDFDEHFGIFTGIGIKNIGWIEKIADSTIKRRVYTIGVPLGFKLGNLKKKHYGFIGGGLDVPFNYREKGFIKRGDKQKFSEWFSDRNAATMPYLFVGMSYAGGTTLKFQYYPGNFFNTSYEQTTNGITTHPYQGYNANLMYITLGIDMAHKSHPKKKKDAGTEAPEAM